MLEFRFGSLKAPTVSPFLLDEILRKKVFQSFRKHVGRDRVVVFGRSLENMPIIVLKEQKPATLLHAFGARSVENGYSKNSRKLGF